MRDEDLPMVDRIRENAELVVSIATRRLGEGVGYDEAGVRWLDGYIQRQHEQGDPANRDGLVSTLGSFLGECIVGSGKSLLARTRSTAIGFLEKESFDHDST